MEKTVLLVEGMSCSHCVQAVTKAVSALPGVGAVNIDLKKKTVQVEHDAQKTPVATLKETIEDQGYDVVG